MSVPDYSYLGSGRAYLKNISIPGQPFIEVGNCSALTISPAEEVKELKNFMLAGGGTQNEVRRLTGVEIALTLHDLNADNFARVARGSVTAIAGAVAKTNQSMGPGAKGTTIRGFVPFPEFPAISPAPVVRAQNGRTAATRANSAAVALNAYIVPAVSNGFFYRVTTAGTTAAAPPVFGTTTGGTTTDGTATLTCMGRIILTAAVDYELRGAGILLSLTAAYTDGETLEADFTSVATDLVQMIVNSAQDYEMMFDGLNEARSGKRVAVRAFRVKLGTVESLSLIGEEFAEMSMTGKLLADASRGGGLSQYFTVGVEN